MAFAIVAESAAAPNSVVGSKPSSSNSSLMGSSTGLMNSTTSVSGVRVKKSPTKIRAMAMAQSDVMADLKAALPTLKGKKFGEYEIAEAHPFVYHDPVDNTDTENGLIVNFK